jgi:hypothetical protein
MHIVRAVYARDLASSREEFQLQLPVVQQAGRSHRSTNRLPLLRSIAGPCCGTFRVFVALCFCLLSRLKPPHVRPAMIHHRRFSEMTPFPPPRSRCLLRPSAAGIRIAQAHRLEPVIFVSRLFEVVHFSGQTHVHQHKTRCWVLVFCPPSGCHCSCRTSRIDKKLALHFICLKLVCSSPQQDIHVHLPRRNQQAVAITWRYNGVSMCEAYAQRSVCYYF